MKLIHSKGWQGEESIVSERTTENQIVALFKTIDWKVFNSITLELDDKNWINVSGNLDKSVGLSIMYEKDGEQFVASAAPTIPEQLQEVLILYLNQDNRYMNYGDELEKKALTNSKRQYEEWKIRYQAQRLVDKKSLIIKSIIALIIVLFITTFSYLFFTDELKFLNDDTTFVKAEVIKIEWAPVKGGFVQLCTYQFIFDNKIYHGSFRGTQFTGKQKVGGFVKVKFDKDDPSTSKYETNLKVKD